MSIVALIKKTMAKILIVEDEVPIAAMYEYKMLQAGHTVWRADNGIAGLKSAEKNLPDLILLDLKMPEMPGDVMLEKLRDTDWGFRMRIVILTNISRDEAPHSLQFLRVDRFVVKAHHTPTQISQIVTEILGTN